MPGHVRGRASVVWCGECGREAMMAAAPVKDAALADLGLLADVVAFKARFYPRSWAQYDQATPGTFKLVPSSHVLTAVEKDYGQMRYMIFGRYPSFDEIMATLQFLEHEINALSAPSLMAAQ